jgi:hypothetical protein
MITAIGVPAASNPTLVPNAPSSNDVSSNDTSLAVPASPAGADELSLSQPDSLATSDAFYQRTSLKIRSHSRVRVTDDGQVRSMSRTKLRFNYDFEAADGTKIRIRVKANLNYSQVSDGDEGLQSTRLRVKAKVLVLQENVSTGISPLLESPEVASEAKNGISQAIDQFNRIAEAATAMFLDSDPLDGDSLIAGLVESFNGLSESLNSMFLSAPADSAAVPSNDVVELLGQPVSGSEEVPPAKPDQIETVPAVKIDSEPTPEAAPQEVGQSNGPEHELAELVGHGETSTLENGVPPEASEQEGSSEGQAVAPAADEHSPLSIDSVMFKLRFQVIQSLTSLVGDFDTDSPAPLASHSMFRASAQFTARHVVSETGANGSLSQDSQIDKRV